MGAGLEKAATLRQKRDAIVAKQKRNRETYERKSAELSRELACINAAILREDVTSWVGQQVRFRYRLPSNDPQAWMNDTLGTLTSVRRSRCTVDFGDRGKWNLPLDEIQHAEDKAERGIILQW